uniref:Uncharacterized protein n=1 Tax=Arundo donax TaxID=35708 RepID=A0A0A8YTP7_ARUDO
MFFWKYSAINLANYIQNISVSSLFSSWPYFSMRHCGS